MEGFVKICAKDISVSVQQNFPAKIARFVLKIKVLQRRLDKSSIFSLIAMNVCLKIHAKMEVNASMRLVATFACALKASKVRKNPAFSSPTF